MTRLDTLDAAVDRVRRLLSAANGQRVLIGICGAPGSGKSTLAELIVDTIDPARQMAAWVPMDGFHLADIELDRLDRRTRKGAIDTFDAAGYLNLLHRLGTADTTADTGATVYAPVFDRAIEQPIAGAIPVFPDTRLVITEGNYLLDDTDLWREVPETLTEVWFCDEDEDLRRQRLIERHVRFGKTRPGAEAWVAEVDEPNARRIAANASRAMVHVRLRIPTKLQAAAAPAL